MLKNNCIFFLLLAYLNYLNMKKLIKVKGSYNIITDIPVLMVLLYTIQNILAIKQMGFFPMSFLSVYCPILHEGETLVVRITIFYTENMSKDCTKYAQYCSK